MNGVEARVLEFLREQPPAAVVPEDAIASGLDLGDPLDLAAALYMLQAAGEVKHIYGDAGAEGWMLLA